jgi:hypothetical protein
VRRPLLAAALLAASSGAAFAQADLATVDPSTVITTITPVEVVMLLESRGYPATAHDLDTDLPYVDTTANGINYSVNLFACSGAKVKACEQVQFRAWFERKGGDDAEKLMTDYDREWVFGKAYVNDEGNMVIEHAFTVRAGVTVANLLDSIELWEGVVEDFTITIGW